MWGVKTSELLAQSTPLDPDLNKWKWMIFIFLYFYLGPGLALLRQFRALFKNRRFFAILSFLAQKSALPTAKLPTPDKNREKSQNCEKSQKMPIFPRCRPWADTWAQICCRQAPSGPGPRVRPEVTSPEIPEIRKFSRNSEILAIFDQKWPKPRENPRENFRKNPEISPFAARFLSQKMTKIDQFPDRPVLVIFGSKKRASKAEISRKFRVKFPEKFRENFPEIFEKINFSKNLRKISEEISSERPP